MECKNNFYQSLWIEIGLSYVLCFLQWLSVTCTLQQFFPISKTTSIKCAHDNNGAGAEFPESLFQCQFSEYRSFSFIFTWLVDKQKLRSETYKIIWSIFSFVSLTGNVLMLQIYKQCTTTIPWMPEVSSLTSGEERLRQSSLFSAQIQSHCHLFLQSRDLTVGIWSVSWKHIC